MGLKREHNPNWKGGRCYCHRTGYVFVNLPSDSSFIAMAKKGDGSHLVREHRLVMAQHLGRPLKSWEIVHHKNGIRNDNRIENLELLLSNKDHLPYTRMQMRINELEQRVILLEAQNVLLKAEVGMIDG